MKKLLLVGIMLGVSPFAVFAQTATIGTTTAPVSTITTVDSGLIPGDFFYFLDRWGEVLNTAFTFNKEKKARLRFDYAKERVAEIKDILARPNAKLDDVADAKKNFDAQVADVATLLKGEKVKGVDVSVLARELGDELDMSRGKLKDVLRGHQDSAGQAEVEIRAKLAALAPADPQAKGLTQALESVTKEKENAAKEENSLDTNLSDELAIFEDVMGAKMAAEKHMEKAMRLRDRSEGVVGQVSERLMNQAQEALKRGDFDSAKRISKEAEREFENVGMMRSGPDMSSSSVNRMMEEGSDIVGSNVDSLEQEIKKGEMMMDGFEPENTGDERNTINR